MVYWTTNTSAYFKDNPAVNSYKEGIFAYNNVLIKAMMLSEKGELPSGEEFKVFKEVAIYMSKYEIKY